MATWLLTGSALVLAAASGAALTILAATALGQVPLLAGTGHWSAAVKRRHDPTSLSYALIACGLLARRTGRRLPCSGPGARTHGGRIRRPMPSAHWPGGRPPRSRPGRLRPAPLARASRPDRGDRRPRARP